MSLGIVIYEDAQREERGGCIREGFAEHEFAPSIGFIEAIKEFDKESENSAEIFFKYVDKFSSDLNIEGSVYDAISNSYPDGDEGIEELTRLAEGLVSDQVDSICNSAGIHKKDFYSVIFEYNNDYELGRVMTGMWLEELSEDMESNEYENEIAETHFPSIDLEVLLSFNINSDSDAVEAEIRRFCPKEFGDDTSHLLAETVKEIRNYLLA
ncbi:hypothetical protein [Vulcanococcus sp.]|uniref:hypothetical protein n=1 Tax=Vulcanococcus sp. TaxID=2856995 RepID=UPI003F69E7F9